MRNVKESRGQPRLSGALRHGPTVGKGLFDKQAEPSSCFRDHEPRNRHELASLTSPLSQQLAIPAWRGISEGRTRVHTGAVRSPGG